MSFCFSCCRLFCHMNVIGGLADWLAGSGADQSILDGCQCDDRVQHRDS